MRNIIVSALLVSVLFIAFVFALGYGLDKQERVDCYKWQEYAQELVGFYLTSSQTEQCEHWGIKVDAPIK